MRLFVSAVLLTSTFAISACSGYDVDVVWTIDGTEPAALCSSLPEGTDVHFSIRSRDVANSANAAVTETSTTAACADGGAKLSTGPFAEIVAELRSDDVIVGVAPPVSVTPGAPDQGYGADGTDVATIDLRVTSGSVFATLTVVGDSCADAGVDNFTVSLFEIPEPRTLVPVDGAVGVDVACTDGAAVFSHAGLRVSGQYVVQATASAGGTSYGTPSSGAGFVAAAATFVTVDLQAR